MRVNESERIGHRNGKFAVPNRFVPPGTSLLERDYDGATQAESPINT